MNKEMILKKVAEECMKELDSIGVPYVRPIEFTINTRAKRRFGQCHRISKNKFSINVMSALCDGKHNAGLKETLMHELLHTVEGCLDHGRTWKGYAARVNAMLGYHVSRTLTFEESGLTEEEAGIKYKYVFVCEDCGQEFRYQRKPRWYNADTGKINEGVCHSSDRGKIILKEKL